MGGKCIRDGLTGLKFCGGCGEVRCKVLSHISLWCNGDRGRLTAKYSAMFATAGPTKLLRCQIVGQWDSVNGHALPRKSRLARLRTQAGHHQLSQRVVFKIGHYNMIIPASAQDSVETCCNLHVKASMEVDTGDGEVGAPGIHQEH